jgi:hypothetical protein
MTSWQGVGDKNKNLIKQLTKLIKTRTQKDGLNLEY